MISFLSVFNIICQRGGKILCSTYNGLIAVLSCEIYVGWVTFEREMYTEFIDVRNRLDEETDRFSDLPKATNVASITAVHQQTKGPSSCVRECIK